MLGLAPFAAPCAEVDGALFAGGRLGLGPGLRDDATSGLTGFFRRGRRGLGFWLRGAPLGFPAGALISTLWGALSFDVWTEQKRHAASLHEVVVPPQLNKELQLIATACYVRECRVRVRDSYGSQQMRERID